MRRKKKASAASKKVAVAKARRKPTLRPLPRLLAPGEAIRLPLRAHNQFPGYDPRLLREEGPSRPIEGIVLSIREIASGQLLPLASGNLGQYVLEVLHDRSFDASFSSSHNAGRASPGEPPQASPVWERVRALLREMAAERKLVSVSDGSISSSPLASLLDGWRVVKVRADQVEVPG